MNKVEEFIKKFKFDHVKEVEDLFLHGNCYYFAIILKEHFNGEIYYLPIDNHFICKIDKDYYDITGKAGFNEKPYKWSDYKTFDKLAHKRIVRDCIDFETRKAI